MAIMNVVVISIMYVVPRSTYSDQQLSLNKKSSQSPKSHWINNTTGDN